ncbi:MAG: hypothetical protein D6733_07670 [Methanobacteriota archaeon]|nr:MAG: hypothetical protein D6733_07670 [Euryarchaeota archaeon]
MVLIGLVIGIVLGGAIGYLYSGREVLGGPAATTGNTMINGGLPPEEISALAGDFVNENLLQPGLTAEVANVSERDGLYEVRLEVSTPQGAQTALVYVSGGGRLLFVNPPIDMTQPLPRPQPPAEEAVKTVDIDRDRLLDDDPWTGNREAGVVVVEFSDFQCPFCARVHPTVQRMEDDYGDRILFVYRDFPLSSIHPMAEKAAEAAQCAFEQDRFWDYHDMLFQRQQSWSSVGTPRFKEYAAELGLDTEAFNTCLDTSKYVHEVSRDLQTGSSLGVTGTPAFFIMASKEDADVETLKNLANGQTLIYRESSDGKNVLFQISGAQPYSVFQSVIDAALSNAG